MKIGERETIKLLEALRKGNHLPSPTEKTVIESTVSSKKYPELKQYKLTITQTII